VNKVSYRNVEAPFLYIDSSAVFSWSQQTNENNKCAFQVYIPSSCTVVANYVTSSVDTVYCDYVK